jgi:hypothetical protein
LIVIIIMMCFGIAMRDSRIAAFLLTVPTLLGACSSDDAVVVPPGGMSGDPPNQMPSDPEPLPVYLLSTTVFGADEGNDRTVYMSLSNSLVQPTFSLDEALELPGVANSETIGGYLYISSGEEPLITRYSITDDLRWVEEDEVSFAAYPLADNANFFYQYMVDDETMYLPFDGYKRIIWNPSAMEIVGTMEDSALEPEVDGLTLEAGGNRTGVRYEGGRVMQPFFYHDEDWYNFGPTSPIAVYDPVTHEEASVIEGPCPGLAVPSQDEAGNTYFSSWDYTPLFALYGEGPAPCVARVRPDRTLDEDFTTDLTDLTDGRYVMNFRYVRDGWGLADVLYHEELDADFSGELDPTVLDQIYEFTNFHLWRIDVERGTAEPYEDVGASSFGWSTASIDGRSYLFVPQDGGERTKIFELDDAGAASEVYEGVGVASWSRVR